MFVKGFKHIKAFSCSSLGNCIGHTKVQEYMKLCKKACIYYRHITYGIIVGMQQNKRVLVNKINVHEFNHHNFWYTTHLTNARTSTRCE